MVEHVNTMRKKEDKNKKILENTKKSNENQQEMNKKKLIKKYHEWFKKLETNLSKVTRSEINKTSRIVTWNANGLL